MTSRALAAAIATLVLALGATGPAWANVQVGSSGWQWGNPLPQGNTIRDVAFAGLQGYAVGDFGTILATPDGGKTWTGLSSGTFTDLTEIQAIGAGSIFAGGGCVGRRSDDGGKTFTRVAFTPVESSCRQPLAGAWFVSKTTGYLVLADGTTLRTDNNGDTFAQKIAVPGTPAAGGGAVKVNDVRFLDASIGFVSTSDGKIYRTADGANSWTVVNDTQRQVRRFLFLDPKKGIAVGDQTLFLATDDGGLTWTSKALAVGAQQNLRTVSCSSVTSCVMATGANQLVRTTDGGATGTLIAPSQDPVFGAAFASPTRVATLGGTGSTATSDDGGATFAPVGGRLSGRYNAMIAGPSGVAFAPGDNGSLAKTTDGGRTWTRGNVSTSEDVRDVSFPTATDGFALDVAGGLFRTADGGATWRALDTGSTAVPEAVLALDRRTVLVIGPKGIRRSTDAGETWVAVRGSVNGSRLSGVDLASGAVIAYGFQDLWRSTDSGRTFTALRKPGKYTKLRNGRKVNRKGVQRIDFIGAGTGYLLDANGFVYRTTDAGKRWSALLGVGTNAGTGMAFGSAAKGYLVINRFGERSSRAGYLLRTTDGGGTWAPELVVPSVIAGRGVAAGAGSTDYLLGGDSSLLFTTAGGLAGGASALTITTKQKRFKKAPKTSITVTGTLKPTSANGGDQVTVSYLRPGSTGWQSQTAKVSASGSFTTSWRVAKGANTFVAQWAGNFQSAGRGSAPLVVTAKR